MWGKQDKEYNILLIRIQFGELMYISLFQNNNVVLHIVDNRVSFCWGGGGGGEGGESKSQSYDKTPPSLGGSGGIPPSLKTSEI